MKMKIIMASEDYAEANSILMRCGYELPVSESKNGVVILETKNITPWLEKLSMALRFVPKDTIIKYRRKIEKTVLQIIKLNKIY